MSPKTLIGARKLAKVDSSAKKMSADMIVVTINMIV